MKALVDSCERLEQALSEAIQRCETIRHEAQDFATFVSSWPLFMVKVRLMAVALQIMTYASSLLKQHEGKGYVFVMVGQSMPGVHWAENEYSSEDKESFRSRGWLIVSPDEIVMIVGHLINEVESGKWAEAIDWLSRYESCFMSDATK